MARKSGLAVVLTAAPARLAFVTARPLNELVDTGWAQALEPVAPQVAQMGEFLRAELAEGTGTCLRARMCCAPSRSVRTSAGADRRAGSLPDAGARGGPELLGGGRRATAARSLENIFSEYGKDLGYPAGHRRPAPWAERGVMLLNRVLTVRPGTPASHRGKGWEAVTECAIRALVAREQPLVAVLWGRDASTLKPMLDGSDCVAIESPHPSPLSASRGFFGSRPFSRQRTAGEDGR